MVIHLYRGKKLYGIEIIEESVAKSKKNGIQTYAGSILADIYRDKKYPEGRKFNLVSLIGEMVNFVGLDTNKLLENAIRQVKENGYFLVSCMHTRFDKTKNGKFVVWSSTKSTKNKWKLKEKKIPRVFLIISNKDLLSQIKKASQNQNYDLILKQKEEIEDYYGDMKLGIYLFQKQ